jgi:hypothetical protein
VRQKRDKSESEVLWEVRQRFSIFRYKELK